MPPVSGRKRRVVMVFGTFDGLHNGHRAFLRQAKSYGDYLIAVLAPDRIVWQLKRRRPFRKVASRLRELKREKMVDKVVIGDKELGSWRVITRYRPAVIALGYDQTALGENLKAQSENFGWRPQIVVMKAYQPQRYKSSLLNSREATQCRREKRSGH